MPQMAPMNWMMLFFMFILTLMMLNTMNYFIFLYPQSVDLPKLIKMNNINWKW